mgnify:CR=1 FL=1
MLRLCVLIGEQQDIERSSGGELQNRALFARLRFMSSACRWRSSNSSMLLAAGSGNSRAKSCSQRSAMAARTRSSIEAFASPSNRRQVR